MIYGQDNGTKEPATSTLVLVKLILRSVRAGLDVWWGLSNHEDCEES